MFMQSRLPRALYILISLVGFTAPLHAQTIDDGIMLGKNELLAGNFYSHDSWDQYWEGDAQAHQRKHRHDHDEDQRLAANYGLSDRLNVIGMVPYVWTRASQGVLHGIQGFQDLTLAAKWNVLEKPLTSYGTLRAIFVVAAGDSADRLQPGAAAAVDRHWAARACRGAAR